MSILLTSGCDDNKIVHEVTPKNIDQALQQAIGIEIATLPTYLSTYYSINRTPDQDKLTADFTKRFINKGKSKQDAETEALELSARIMVFANKAGANIMSVLVEEMLHMSLVSNVTQALAIDPILTGKSPTVWPAYLAGHEPEFPINRAKLSVEQLEIFKKIESPVCLKGAKDEKEDKDKPLPYFTIGDFYQAIENCLKEHYRDDCHYHSERPQLVPNRGYYAQNNIDTLYYDKQHKPVYDNASDSGDLIHVVDQKTALKALEIIVEQGEGHDKEQYDDKSKKELSHYSKFAQLQQELKSISQYFKGIFGDDFEVEPYFIYNFADNANTSDYPKIIADVSTLTNAIYSYLFIMSQNCYRKDKHTQFEIFMFGIHKTMLWILSSLCGEMTGFKYIGKDGREYTATATYDEYKFSAASSPKSQIIELFNKAVAGYPNIAYIEQRILDLPDVSIEQYQHQSQSSLMA